MFEAVATVSSAFGDRKTFMASDVGPTSEQAIKNLRHNCQRRGYVLESIIIVHPWVDRSQEAPSDVVAS